MDFEFEREWNKLLKLMLERFVAADFSMLQQDELGSEVLDSPCIGL